MNVKTKAFFTILILFLLFAAGRSGYLLFMERQKTSKLENNIRYGYETGFRIVDTYKAKNGQLVARNQALEMTKQMLTDGIAADVMEKLDNLGIKPSRVESFSETVIRHEKEILTSIRDTIIEDTVNAEVFHYRDPFYLVDGIRVGAKQRIRIESTDSLIQVVYRGSRYNKKGKKVPGFCFWVPRRLEQVITSHNPSSSILYSKTIIVSK